MTHLFSKVAATALLGGSIASQAQAHTEWRFHYKGAPCAASHAESDRGGYRVRNALDCPRTVIRRRVLSRTWLICPPRQTRR